MSETIQGHHLQRANGRYFCVKCQWYWQNKPRTLCPGVPRYEWRTVPPGLMSKTSLNKKKLQPGGPVRGVVMNVYDNSFWDLYDEREAIPYTPPKRERKERRRPNPSELRLLFRCYTSYPLTAFNGIQTIVDVCQNEGWLVRGKGDADHEHAQAVWQITKRGVAELEHWMPGLREMTQQLAYHHKRDERVTRLLNDVYRAWQHDRDPRFYQGFEDRLPDADHVMQRLKKELGFGEHPDPRVYNDAIAWARQLLERSNWCVLDTETTGLDDEDEVIQLAIIAPDGSVLLDTLLRPTVAVGSSSEIHGLTDEALADAPTLADVAARIRTILNGRLIVTYNADFDQRLFSQTRERYNLEPLAPKAQGWECAMLRYAAFAGDWHDYYRDWRYQPLPGGDHSALGDARATLALIRRMAEAKPMYTPVQV